jgi:glutamate dehydrogenase (NAD(P)+)
MIVTKEALKHLGLPIRGAKVAVQGFGNVGSVAARLLQEEGLVVVAVSDVSGAIYSPTGLDIDDVVEWTREHRYVSGFPDSEAIAPDELLTLDVDVLLPAAVESTITRRNAGKIKAKVICEGANGPTTPSADKMLENHGAFVIPDILANAGGVTVSYFEWVQDRAAYFWDEHTVNERLQNIIQRSFHDVLSVARRHSVNMRIAAYMLAIERVAAVHRLRGLYA